MTTQPTDVRHISVTIDRPQREVYEFASKPENLPQWASGLSDSIEHVGGGEWIARSAFGTVKVRFAEPNDLGVLDHDVTLDSGVSVHNPLRVLARDPGHSELVFTLFRRPGVTDEELDADAVTVERDLRKLKELLE